MCAVLLAPETFLLFSRRTSISRMLVDSTDDAPDVRLPVHELKSVRALDFDPVDLVAYWIENQSNTIRRARDTAAYVSGTLNARCIVYNSIMCDRIIKVMVGTKLRVGVGAAGTVVVEMNLDK